MHVSISRGIWTVAFLLLTFLHSINAQAGPVSYANDFVNPDYIVEKKYGQNTLAAQDTIVAWAMQSSVGGPWSVMDKPFTPPSGDKHDYMSWAPYWWPDCSKVANATELTPEQIWTTCPYISRDGLFNPDVRTVNDVGNFQSLSDAVLYNTLAWSITGRSTFAEAAANFTRVWFLDEATRMNPNLNYAQIQRGPNSTGGTHTGVLDLKCMTKVVTGILILRKSNSSAWTADLDDGMNAWTEEYVTWLENTPIAIQEARAANNHGSFYYNQLASLKILLGDFTGAKNATDTYFNTLYMSQIAKGGEQPLEAVRTRPYHYRAYNLAAMITNARLAEYASPNNPVWNKTTNQGATIKDALDFAMTISPSASKEDNVTAELFPDIAAVASVYGDPEGKYAAFLGKAEPQFTEDGYYLWDQPFAEQEGSTDGPTGSASSSSSPSDNSNNNKNANQPNGQSAQGNNATSMDSCGLLFTIILSIVYLSM